jgi:hypothetical protein
MFKSVAKVNVMNNSGIVMFYQIQLADIRLYRERKEYKT